MRNLISIFLFLFILIQVKLGLTQEKQLQINEISIYNTDTISPYLLRWIEIYNASKNEIDLGNYCFTNDPNNINKFNIFSPTIIPPDSYFLLYNSDTIIDLSNTYRINFMLDDTSLFDNGNAFFAIFDINNHQLIDSFSYNINEQREGISIGFFDKNRRELLLPSPLAVNKILQNEEDNLTTPTYSATTTVLFLVGILIIVVIVYTLKRKSKREIMEDKKEEKITQPLIAKKSSAIQTEIDTELLAITMAFHVHLNERNHDIEATGFWLKNNPTHSPWANRSYNFKKTPNKK